MSLPLYQIVDHLMSQSAHSNRWLTAPQTDTPKLYPITIKMSLITHVLINTHRSLPHHKNERVLSLKECTLGVKTNFFSLLVIIIDSL